MNKVVKAEALPAIEFVDGETLSVRYDNMNKPVRTVAVRTGDGWTTEERPLPPDVIVESEL